MYCTSYYLEKLYNYFEKLAFGGGGRPPIEPPPSMDISSTLGHFVHFFREFLLESNTFLNIGKISKRKMP